jgi:hypothetical protein
LFVCLFVCLSVCLFVCSYEVLSKICYTFRLCMPGRVHSASSTSFCSAKSWSRCPDLYVRKRSLHVGQKMPASVCSIWIRMISRRCTAIEHWFLPEFV